MTGKQVNLRVIVEHAGRQAYIARANLVTDKQGRNLYVTGMKIPGFPSQIKYSRHATGSTNSQVTRIDGTMRKVSRADTRVPFASIAEPECVWTTTLDVFEQPWGMPNRAKPAFVLKLSDLPSHVLMVEHHLMAPEYAESFIACYDYAKAPIGYKEVVTLQLLDPESDKLLVTTVLGLPGERLEIFQRGVSEKRVKIPRNLPCPCGRPIKFKRCHGLFTHYWWDNPVHAVFAGPGGEGDVTVERIG